MKNIYVSFEVHDEILSLADAIATNILICSRGCCTLDRQDLSLICILSDNTLQAQSVVSDSQPSSVREFDLDLNPGILQLYFDEAIRDFNLLGLHFKIMLVRSKQLHVCLS